jgi:hypothetical protein
MPRRVERPAIADKRLSTEAFLPTSLRRIDALRTGFKTSMRSIIQRICGFHSTASRTPPAAEGVITSYETRSTFISGRVKHARSPHTRRLIEADLRPHSPLMICVLPEAVLVDQILDGRPAEQVEIKADIRAIKIFFGQHGNAVEIFDCQGFPKP